MDVKSARLVSALLLALVLLLSACAEGTVGEITCAAETESPHYSTKAKLLVAKTRYSCDADNVELTWETKIERLNYDGTWSNYKTERHVEVVKDAGVQQTAYTSKACIAGTYRSSTRLVAIDGWSGYTAYDTGATASRYTNCINP